MKYWMKIFIPLTLIMLIFFNGLTWIQREMIDDNLVKEEEEKIRQEVSEAVTIQAYAVSSYLKDCFVGDAQGDERYARLEEWKKAGPNEIKPLMENYLKYHTYQQDGIYLSLYKTERVLTKKIDFSTPIDLTYWNDSELFSFTYQYQTDYDQCYRNDPLQKHPIEPKTLEDGDVHFVKDIRDGTLACAMRPLPDCRNFCLVFIQSYDRDLGDRTLKIIQILGLVASAILAVFMLLIMRRMLKPVSDLTAATREFAQGDRSQRIDPIGWDEVAELARLFNSMADENQRLELVEEDAERKQRFLDSFTHELRTPLTNIHGYSELMKRVQLTEEDRLRYLDYVMHESRRLNRLSEELFGLTVLRENTTKMERVSCGRLLDFAEQTLREKARKKDVRLVCEQSDCTVYGSKALLESLCTNLCENAIRACEAGDEVRVSFREEEDGAVLRVADTGRGIAPEDLAHITEPFYRVDKARSRAEGGVGLGLYLCSEIVRIHGAAMSFESQEGEGTTVTVRFPKPEQD